MTENSVDLIMRNLLADRLQRYLEGKLVITEVITDEIKQSCDPAIQELVRRWRRHIPNPEINQNDFARCWFVRLIAFLRTDLKYPWSTSTSYQILRGMLIAIFLGVMAISFLWCLFALYELTLRIEAAINWPACSPYDPLFGASLAVIYCGAIIGLFFIVNHAVHKFRKKDPNYWPFLNREQYERVSSIEQ